MIVRTILLTLTMSLTLMGCHQRSWTPSSKLTARSSHAMNTPRPPVALRQSLHSDVHALSVPRVTATSATTARPYALDSGDRLRVTVFGQQNLSRIYPVDPSGYISMPLIGAVKVRGMSTFQAEERISNILKQKYIKDPKVSVEVAASRPFFILGEVRNAGQFPYVAGMTAQTAIAIAGGFTPRAKKKHIQLVRIVSGVSYTRTVPLNVKILPGDTITVRERFF